MVQITTITKIESTQLLRSPSCLNIFDRIQAPRIKPMANISPYQRMVIGDEIKSGLQSHVIKLRICAVISLNFYCSEIRP